MLSEFHVFSDADGLMHCIRKSSVDAISEGSTYVCDHKPDCCTVHVNGTTVFVRGCRAETLLNDMFGVPPLDAFARSDVEN